MEHIISVENLTFGYEKEAILNHISFSIEKGDFVGVIGSNGTGKSTLIKLLLGQLFPVFGTICLFGEKQKNFKDWSKIGYVPQIGLGTAENFPATAKEIVLLNLYSQIGFMRFPKAKHKQQALQALKKVEMQDYANKQIGNLSGGQQQRVMIAKALVSDPQILILDEPTTGIDTHTSQLLFQLLRRLNKENGITIIMVTHDIKKTSQYVNRMLLLEDTQISEVPIGW